MVFPTGTEPGRGREGEGWSRSSVLGLAVAAGLTHVVSLVFESASGIELNAGIGPAEIGFAAWIIAALGALLAVVPAALVYRQPVVDALRGA